VLFRPIAAKTKLETGVNNYLAIELYLSTWTPLTHNILSALHLWSMTLN